MNLNEVAPPTKKHERMVKHIKKAYKKDGKLTDDEKSIAYATSWKNYNKTKNESVENGKVDLTLKPEVNNVLKQQNKEYDRGLLAQVNKDGSYDVAYWYDKYKAYPVEVEVDGKSVKKDAKNIHIKFHPELKKESFEINKAAHKAAQKKTKMRNLAKGNTNPNEKAAAEKKAGGPKLYGEEISRRRKPSAVAKKKKLEKLLIDKEVNKIQNEEMTYQEAIDAGWEMTGEGIWWPPQPESETVTEKLSFSMFKKKAAERKPEKAQDAGARARRKMKRKEHAKYVSGSEDNVPDDIRDHYEVSEGSLHKWFSQSKSKDGKPGWVQSDGSPCANEPGETKTPKCYSSAKRASMSKKELRSADARKARKDPNQQQKSGAAKPTYVATDKKKKKMKESLSWQEFSEACWKGYEKKGMKTMFGKRYPNCVKKTKKEEVEYVAETKDRKGKGSGTKDACYHKVKARFKVWPSAYGSGALVKCRKVGAANWGNSKKEEIEYAAYAIEAAAWQRKEGKNPEGGLNQKGVDSYRRENPGSKLKTAVTTKPSKLKKGSKAANRRKSFCARMGGMKKRLTSAKTANDPDSRINKALRKWNC